MLTTLIVNSLIHVISRIFAEILADLNNYVTAISKPEVGLLTLRLVRISPRVLHWVLARLGNNDKRDGVRDVVLANIKELKLICIFKFTIEMD